MADRAALMFSWDKRGITNIIFDDSFYELQYLVQVWFLESVFDNVGDVLFMGKGRFMSDTAREIKENYEWIKNNPDSITPGDSNN